MRIVVITGASQGIGATVARRLAEPETILCLVSRNRERLEAVASEVRIRGADALVVPCDVTDPAAVEGMARSVRQYAGVPDVVVNNAGLFVPGSVVETDPESFRDQVDVNLTSAFLVTRAFLSDMMARESGHLFFMASVASIRGYPGGVAYCAAKHGLLGLARAVREETRTSGVRVTSLLPGATYTPSWEGADIPESRFMPPEDVAEAIAAALSMSPRTVAEEILLRPQLGDI